MQHEDTIVAIATPPGRGGIGIVRLSGPDARTIAEPLLKLRHPPAAGRVRLGTVVDPEDGSALDEVVVTLFAEPHSYTGEDVIEIAAHGAPVVLDTMVRACVARGARPAEPGEFTQRAFLAGRLALTEAEAVNDLIQASTLQQARVAAAQLGGSLARNVRPIKDQLVDLIAELEAGVDFAEDDLDLIPQARMMTMLDSLWARTDALASSYAYGRLLRTGFTLAIVGRPNAGKSSLFNRLLARDRAIVTAQPGTTRDAITESFSLGGIPVELVDTAGLRTEPEGEAEAVGIARTRMHMAEADLVLHVLDATAGAHPEDMHAEDTATEAALAGRASLTVVNKVDLLASGSGSGFENGLGFGAAIGVSALTGQGVKDLKRAIVAQLAGANPHAEHSIITNARQHEAVTGALRALMAARAAAGQGLPHEMILLDLHTALDAFDSLTGATTTDDILERIFSQFCIGK